MPIKKVLSVILLTWMVANANASGATSNVQLVYQPIYRSLENPDSAVWKGKDYVILGVMYLNVTYHGKPAYGGISEKNHLLTNSKHRIEQSIDGNVLSILGVNVNFDAVSSEKGLISIDVRNAKPVATMGISIEEAVKLAMECIRKTATSSGCSVPPVSVIGPEDAEIDWKMIERLFNRHDMDKPFVK